MTSAAASEDPVPDAATLACAVCGQPHRVEPLPPDAVARCVRCGSAMAANPWNGLHRTAALSTAALLLYVPGNVFPILSITQNGARSESTVMGSVRLLWEGGDYLVALVVFAASIVIPPVKLAGLLFLALSTMAGTTRWRSFRTRLFRIVEAIGKWAMLDVYVLAVLVSVVKLRGLASVAAEEGVFPFTACVILTLLATASFDPQEIWRGESRPA